MKRSVISVTAAGAVEATLYQRFPDPAGLPQGARVSAKHTVRIDVPPMTFERPPRDQVDELRAALDAVDLLWAWLLGHTIS